MNGRTIYAVVLAAAFIGLFGRLAPAQTPAQDNLRAQFDQVKTLVSTHNFSEALEVLARMTPNSPRARAVIGLFFENGLGVPKDQNRAVWWYREAAKDGDREGLFRLASHFHYGVGVKRDSVLARTLLKQCAEANDERCLNNYGRDLLHGLDGDDDPKSAIHYFEAAAAKGQVNAITSLADCYENGVGVEVDLKKAVSLYTEAAKKDFFIAHESLGGLYERGLGVPRNDVYAAMHYTLATKQVRTAENSYYRQEYDKATIALSRILVSLSDAQVSRVHELVQQWPNVPAAQTEIASNRGVQAHLSNQALMSKLSASTALIFGRTKNGSVTGSGFWIAPEILISNRHVVEDIEPDGIFVIRAGSSQPLQASILVTSRSSNTGDTDIAVLRVVGADGVVTLPLTVSIAPLGEVVAAGFPGFAIEADASFWSRVSSDDWTAPSNVLTSGQIAAVQRPRGGAEILMHTAPIYSGNSGGPLVDRCGRAVGMNTYRLADSKKQEEANFAISAATIMNFLRDRAIPFKSAHEDCP